ncbi:MAG: hypothetical protein CSYNP_03888 [Syntrophus sp. SKADARSKE-3]|nr:hypothetical protein [Syntrophus sp. SKADARSKE-3]
MFRKPEGIGTCPRKGLDEACSVTQQMVVFQQPLNMSSQVKRHQVKCAIKTIGHIAQCLLFP